MQRKRLRVVIAGDGPSRATLEMDVQQRGLEQNCVFLGELRKDEVCHVAWYERYFSIYECKRSGHAI